MKLFDPPVVTRYERKAVCAEYADHFTKSGFVEVTVWHNGEGVDVATDGGGSSDHIGFTWEQWRALKRAMKALDV